jgi:hypothetical protein
VPLSETEETHKRRRGLMKTKADPRKGCSQELKRLDWQNVPEEEMWP